MICLFKNLKRLGLFLTVLIWLSLCSINSQAASYDWSLTTTVIVVEPTYLPSKVRFRVADNAGGVCAGQWLDYYGKGANSESNSMGVFSALLAALASGNRVVIYGTNDCKVHYVHILKD